MVPRGVRRLWVTPALLVAAAYLCCVHTEARVPQYAAYIAEGCEDVILQEDGLGFFSVSVSAAQGKLVVNDVVAGPSLTKRRELSTLNMFPSDAGAPVAVIPSLHNANVLVLSEKGYVREITGASDLGDLVQLPSMAPLSGCTDFAGVMVDTTPVYFACCNVLFVAQYLSSLAHAEDIGVKCNKIAADGSAVYFTYDDGSVTPEYMTLSPATIGSFASSRAAVAGPANLVSLDVRANAACPCVDIMYKSADASFAGIYLVSYMSGSPSTSQIDEAASEVQVFAPDPQLGSRFFVSRTTATAAPEARNVYAVEAGMGSVYEYKEGQGFPSADFQAIDTAAADGIDVKGDYLIMCTAEGQMLYNLADATPGPTTGPAAAPTSVPTATPTLVSTSAPTSVPTAVPTSVPTEVPTAVPTSAPTSAPTAVPTSIPTSVPTSVPTAVPTSVPTSVPSSAPTSIPTSVPTAVPTSVPTSLPTAAPTSVPTAVPTSVPTAVPTPAPTSAPTAAPTTTPTSAPTPAPTSVPTTTPTSAPTAVPDTPTPDTGVPATDVPPTEVPNALASATASPPVAATAPPALPEEKQITTAGGVAAVASAVGGGGGAATRLVMATLGCYKEGAAPVDLPFALHPTQIKVAGSNSAGAVVGNALVAVGFAVVCAAVLFVVQSCGGACSGVFASLDAQGLLRLPSAPFFVFQLLYQGTTYGAMNLVLHPPSAVLWVTGFVALMLCVVLPVLVFSTVTKNVPERARYMREDRPRSWAMVWLLGPGEWVSLREDCHWVNRYATAVRMYGQEFAWFSLIDFAGSFALSALSAVDATTLVSCGHVKMSAALVFLIMLVIEARLWPHARMRDSAMDFVGLGLQMSAMVLMGLGYYSGARDSTDSWTFATAGILLTAAVGFVLLKLACDVSAEAYIFLTKRRVNLQQKAFEMFEDVPAYADASSSDHPASEGLPSPNFRPRSNSLLARTSLSALPRYSVTSLSDSRSSGRPLDPLTSTFGNSSRLLPANSAEQRSAPLALLHA